MLWNRRYETRRQKKNSLNQVLIWFIVIFVVSLALLLYGDHKARPYIQSMSQSRAEALATYAINSAVSDEMTSQNITYNDLVEFDKTEDGKINAVKTNIVKLNQLKAALSKKTQNYLSNMDEAILTIPLGNIINGEFLSGRGPKLQFRMVPVGSVGTDIENVFTSAGINQTRHQIMLKVNVQVSVLLPVSTAYASVETSVCIAETVIVGDVPDTYTNVEGDNSSTLGKINDYT